MTSMTADSVGIIAVLLIFETRIFAFQGKIFSLLCFIRASSRKELGGQTYRKR